MKKKEFTYYYSYVGYGLGILNRGKIIPEGGIIGYKYDRLFNTEEEMLDFAIERTAYELNLMIKRKLKYYKG